MPTGYEENPNQTEAIGQAYQDQIQFARELRQLEQEQPAIVSRLKKIQAIIEGQEDTPDLETITESLLCPLLKHEIPSFLKRRSDLTLALQQANDFLDMKVIRPKPEQ